MLHGGRLADQLISKGWTRMIALPVSFFMMMIYGYILTTTMFREQRQAKPCYVRVSYPKGYSKKASFRKER